MRAARFAAVGLLLLGLWLRLSTRQQVFVDGSVLPLTADSAYHLHRSLETFAQFPHAPVFDPLMNWPEGAFAHVADGFDVLSALTAKLALAESPTAAAAVMVHVPIAFGLLTALLAVFLAGLLARGDPWWHWIALVTWMAALLLPIGIFISLLGRTDHHCAEAVAVAALCSFSLARFPLAALRRRTLAERVRFEALGAAAITFAMYMFNGSEAYVALAVPVLIVAILCDRGSLDAATPAERKPYWFGSGVPALLFGAAGTAALYALNLRQHRQLFSYAFPSLLQPSLLVLAGLICALLLLVARRVEFGADERWPRRRLQVAVPSALAVMAALAAVPAIRAEVISGVASHLLRGDAWMQQVVEAQPLLRWGTLLTAAGWAQALQYYGWFAPISCVLLPLAIAATFREQRGRSAAFAWWACCMIALALVQNRFARPLMPLASVWIAIGAAALARRLLSSAPLRARGLVLCGVVLILLTADLRFLTALRSRPDAAQLASLFLSRENHVRADGTRAGALTPWALGHTLTWPAQTGVVANGFLYHVGREVLERSQTALAGREAGALQLMQERDLDWLVVGASYYGNAAAGRARVPALVAAEQGAMVNLRYLTLVPMAVTMLGGGGMPEAGVPHLEHLAPRWASYGIGGEEPDAAIPELWVFERVRGARLVGRTTPGAQVLADIVLRNGLVRIPFEAFTRADGEGRFELRVPVWNDYRVPGLGTGTKWVLRSGDVRWSLRVSERDVREGREVVASPPADAARDTPEANVGVDVSIREGN